jgi:hypothetical protein
VSGVSGGENTKRWGHSGTICNVHLRTLIEQVFGFSKHFQVKKSTREPDSPGVGVSLGHELGLGTYCPHHVLCVWGAGGRKQ